MLSHKLLRWLAPLLLVVLLVASVAAAPESAAAQLLLLLQAAFYGAAALGYLLPRRGALARLLGVPLFFVTIHLAFLAGLRRWARGERVGTWNPDRPAAAGPTRGRGR